MQNQQHKGISTHDLIEEARALIIACAAARWDENSPEPLDFSFSADIQRSLLKRANDLLLAAAGEVAA